ncbi:MAG: hypothetical protein VB036_12365 [Propionicimonas sp.]|nr:hypothetical protein [Propionicimonas sp.]
MAAAGLDEEHAHQLPLPLAAVKDGYFQSAAKGQEFVTETTPDVLAWVQSLA